MTAHQQKTVFMPDYIKEQTELAHTYALDGAYTSASRVLSDLAHVVNRHSKTVVRREKEMEG